MPEKQHISKIDDAFLRVCLLKVAFHPQQLRRCQALIIYAALEGGEFTADECLPGEATAKDGGVQDPKIAGIAFGSLASMKIITWVDRKKATRASRNGAFTNVWSLTPGKRETALTWLDRNQFPRPAARQTEMAL